MLYFYYLKIKKYTMEYILNIFLNDLLNFKKKYF